MKFELERVNMPSSSQNLERLRALCVLLPKAVFLHPQGWGNAVPCVRQGINATRYWASITSHALF